MISSFVFSSAQSGTPTIFGVEIQPNRINPQTGVIRCITDEYETYQRANGKESINQFETWLAPKIAELKNTSNNKKAVVKIPVVVHVIHNGQPVRNSSKNITDARVISQITVLNQDFRRMIGTPGYNTNAVGADIEVEFCLAQVDPNGNPTNGIDRVNTNDNPNLAGLTLDRSNIESFLKPLTIWDPSKYFNIWVAQFEGDLVSPQQVLGYAQFPQSPGIVGVPTGGTANTDGVIIEWRAFGSVDTGGTGTYFSGINKGRTTTHEMGHSFGLRHIWGDQSSCTVNAGDTFNDYCPDTPAANGPNYDCNQVYDSCPAAPGNDMTENYMDYTNDTCMNTFTQDQKARILAVLQNSPRRNTLTTSTACNAIMATNDVRSQNENISIYPNPVKDYLNIKAKNGTKLVRYVIYNALGQEAMKNEIKSESDFKIHKSKLGTGLFIITVYTNNSFKTEKFIVE